MKKFNYSNYGIYKNADFATQIMFNISVIPGSFYMKEKLTNTTFVLSAQMK